MNLKGIVLVLFVTLFGSSLYAQQVYTSSGKSVEASRKAQKKKQKGFDPSRIIVGGGLGLNFGDVTAISVSPIVGYKISDRFAAGVGFGYQYLSWKDYWEVYDPNTSSYQYYPFRANMYSGSVWGRYIFWKNIFAHLEYEHNFMTYKNYYSSYNYNTSQWDINTEKVKYDAPCLLVGAGFRQPVGERLSLVALILYDVIQDQYSPYYKRVDFRIGVNVGF